MCWATSSPPSAARTTVGDRGAGADLAVGRQGEEGRADLVRADPGVAAHGRDPLGEDLDDPVAPVLQVVDGRLLGAREDPPRVVDEDERRLRAAAVDTEEDGHDRWSNSWISTPWTT